MISIICFLLTGAGMIYVGLLGVLWNPLCIISGILFFCAAFLEYHHIKTENCS